jgi:hypothetical protein
VAGSIDTSLIYSRAFLHEPVIRVRERRLSTTFSSAYREQAIVYNYKNRELTNTNVSYSIKSQTAGTVTVYTNLSMKSLEIVRITKNLHPVIESE